MAEGGLSAAMQLPYRAEYSKSGRAACKLCKSPIDKDSLRLAVMVQSRFHDGKDAHWHHSKCFFLKHRPKSVGDIAHYEALRYDDQKVLEKAIASGGGGKGKGDGPGIKLEDFKVEYAKSAASTCVACETKIAKQEVRIATKDYSSERALMYGPMDRWHHVKCFAKIRQEVQFLEEGKKLKGFRDLEPDDKDMITKTLPKVAAVKRKLENGSDKSSDERVSKKAKKEGDSLEKKIKKQNDDMYKIRDRLKEYNESSQLSKNDLISMLNKNNTEVPTGVGKILDYIADIMTFGAMKKCKTCKTGQYVFRSGFGYQCIGYISEFTKCMALTDEPERVPFKIPNDLREHEIFVKYKPTVQKRIIPKHAIVTEAFTTPAFTAKIVKDPLKKFRFAIIGISSEEKSKLKKRISSFGGKVTSTVDENLAAVISTKKDTEKIKWKEIQTAKNLGIPVVSSKFVEGITDVNYSLSNAIKADLICDWAPTDIRRRLINLNPDFENNITEKKRGFEFESKEKSKTLTIKDGAVVDPDSGLEEEGHVLKFGKKHYTAILNKVNIEEGTNSFYKIQVIESDRGRNYWVFRSWGRIGTTIGGNTTDEFGSKEDAIEMFCTHFLDKTGNTWGKPFTKQPGSYIALEVDFGEKEVKKIAPSTQSSSLPLTVQELICLIFDVETMKKTMLEFELDLEKMPLGKISKAQILDAYRILNDVTALQEKKEDAGSRRLLDASNRFFSLIPHSFGTGIPPILNNDALIKSKLDMLESLLEIELAFEILSSGDSDEGPSVDGHYKRLNANIDPVEGNSQEYEFIQKYLNNTHAATHSSYSLDIEQIFAVKRKGEDKRYRAFKKLHNRKLLWHGSRTTNFGGILSQGLRIAPKEAPSTGYMFGKGIYFADMVSKSANYCCTSPGNTTGLLLLCEVALGDMHEMKRANDRLTEAPKGKHSVKGLGGTHPDPSETLVLSDGVEVPFGKGITSSTNSDLLYNEYIVYDVGQVNIRYLVRVNFNYTKRKQR